MKFGLNRYGLAMVGAGVVSNLVMRLARFVAHALGVSLEGVSTSGVDLYFSSVGSTLGIVVGVYLTGVFIAWLYNHLLGDHPEQEFAHLQFNNDVAGIVPGKYGLAHFLYFFVAGILVTLFLTVFLGMFIDLLAHIPGVTEYLKMLPMVGPVYILIGGIIGSLFGGLGAFCYAAIFAALYNTLLARSH